MVLRKIQANKAAGKCVLPNWPTQAWFPKSTAMLQDPIELKPNKIYFHFQAIRRSYIHYMKNFLSLFASHRLPLKKLGSTELSSRMQDNIMASWRSGTAIQYRTYLSRWESYCDEKMA